MMAPVLIGALLGFILGAVFGVGVACRFLEWAHRQPSETFDVMGWQELLDRKRERERREGR